ncbi:hypothetical protein [Hanstruepera marina]|uniref:hypothetical protein n=1 Tax=Hanstruepera marina TaxID=2873265 RepID=UPI001CA6A778|nr:hypothetical protein [Hanstruepera marina]
MKTIKYIIILLAVSLTATSCVLDDDEQVFNEGPYVLAFPSAEVTGYFLNDNADDYTYTVPLSITGGNGFPLDQDVNAMFEFDSSSTATEGVEFDFVDNSGSVTIEGGNTFANLPIVVHSGALDPANPATVVLNITGGSSASNNNIVASGNTGTVTIYLQATCSSDLGGTYALTVTSDSGTSNFHPAEVLVEIEEGQYLTATSGTWDVGVLNGGVREGFIFQEVCGSIVIPQQNLAGIYGNLLEGTDVLGTVDPTTGDITLEYTIGFSGNSTFVTYTATYVKL